MPDYPARESFFAHRFVRLLTKTAAAQELGPEVTWLLTVVAHQEDAKRYCGAVTYWNEQLMPLCGFRSKGRLVRVREAAVRSGWLHYETGGRTQPGRYWCLVPNGYDSLPDGPCDESDPFQDRTANGTQTEPKPNGKRNQSRTPSTLFPSPNPEGGKPADAGPSAAEINDVVTAWNASGLAQCRKLTDKRRSALRKRLADPDWRQTWREALDRAARSSFCQGENDRGWKADIDWFLQPDSVTRILEGKYDDRNGQRGNSVSAVEVDFQETADVLARKRAEQAVGNGGPA
jgi:hypothetical protein